MIQQSIQPLLMEAVEGQVVGNLEAIHLQLFSLVHQFISFMGLSGSDPGTPTDQV